MRERDLWPDCGRNDDKKGVTALTLAGQDQWLLWEYYFSNNSHAPERAAWVRNALTPHQNSAEEGCMAYFCAYLKFIVCFAKILNHIFT